MLRLLAIIWAAPYTLLGLTLGFMGVCTDGHARIRGRAVEFYGGMVTWLVKRLPSGQFTLAVTLGHTVLGQSDASLDVAHDHEMIHVRQYERWGPLMGPMYLLCALVLWLVGAHPYRDNPFEREAYEKAGCPGDRRRPLQFAIAENCDTLEVDDPVSIALAAQWLRSAHDVVVFTGAGVSAESGIPTFRDEGGFWQAFPPEELGTWRGLLRTAVARPAQIGGISCTLSYSRSPRRSRTVVIKQSRRWRSTCE